MKKVEVICFSRMMQKIVDYSHLISYVIVMLSLGRARVAFSRLFVFMSQKLTLNDLRTGFCCL